MSERLAGVCSLKSHSTSFSLFRRMKPSITNFSPLSRIGQARCGYTVLYTANALATIHSPMLDLLLNNLPHQEPLLLNELSWGDRVFRRKLNHWLWQLNRISEEVSNEPKLRQCHLFPAIWLASIFYWTYWLATVLKWDILMVIISDLSGWAFISGQSSTHPWEMKWLHLRSGFMLCRDGI